MSRPAPTTSESFLDQIHLEIAAPPGALDPVLRFALKPCGGSGGLPGPLDKSRRLEAQAMRWSYVLRNRTRWIGQVGAKENREKEATQTLQDFGIDAGILAQLAKAPRVVVVMPYTDEGTGWAGRLLPWEYLLASATRRLRPDPLQSFTVLRELRPVRAQTPRWSAKKGRSARLLLVDSAPAGLREHWDFEKELARMQRALEGAQCERLSDPSLEQLRQKIADFEPDFVHLSGFDSLQGLQELSTVVGGETQIEQNGEARGLAELLADPRNVHDGMLLAGRKQPAAIVSALELCKALSGGGRHCSYFCGISMANSAERTAALLVGEGAALAAVGFQGDIDDTIADFLFELIYGQFGRAAWHAPLAFEQAWMRTRLEPRATRGTGFAFWCGEPLLDYLPAQASAAQPAPSNEEPRLIYKPVAELNYSVLHNLQPLFTQFEVLSGSAKGDGWLQVQITLHLGEEQARYTHRFRAENQRLDLGDRIRLPLTSTLLRTLPEAVNSTLEVQLSWKDQILSCETHALRLLPVDQWRDNRRDGPWLPSFVLPRDPAVQRAVEQAQRYVRVLRDNPAAGFEGYQAAPNPDDDEQLREVDLQVQAIWATLLHDWQLGYINPPPTYSDKLDSQRLRTPSAIHGGRMGTCIDLALLFAACLELIDVYPVIFLLNGHALPGYWRHDSFREDFQNLSALSADSAAIEGDSGQKFAWQARGRGPHSELRRLIRARRLVPLETVRLTEHCGFVEAIESGIQALQPVGDFHSMLDVVQARIEHITPLPVGREGA